MEDFMLTHRITSYECSADHLMKPEFFMHLCQEMAEEHADMNNAGYKWAISNHKIWVETQGNFELLRRPAWKEEITLRTNTGKASPLQARRFVEMADAQGQIIAKADLLWVLIDVTSRRPFPLKRTDLIFAELECPAITEELPPCDFPESPCETVSMKAARRDIDFNAHINNSAYLTWALDTLPDAHTPAGAPKRFHLTFRKESRLGDALEITHYVQGARTRHIIAGADGTRAEVDIEWS